MRFVGKIRVHMLRFAVFLFAWRNRTRDNSDDTDVEYNLWYVMKWPYFISMHHIFNSLQRTMTKKREPLDFVAHVHFTVISSHLLSVCCNCGDLLAHYQWYVLFECDRTATICERREVQTILRIVLFFFFCKYVRWFDCIYIMCICSCVLARIRDDYVRISICCFHHHRLFVRSSRMNRLIHAY